ncbi:hypothetical protein V9L05_20495 [Bernardetia sp. Wsw4-3y2]|uniref:hypothetical protein n=1 Tax=Bernardetia sp. Wsw4-3y2 TaxID=3127471 RepID=UPI0030CABE87
MNTVRIYIENNPVIEMEVFEWHFEIYNDRSSYHCVSFKSEVSKEIIDYFDRVLNVECKECLIEIQSENQKNIKTKGSCKFRIENEFLFFENQYQNNVTGLY